MCKRSPNKKARRSLLRKVRRAGRTLPARETVHRAPKSRSAGIEHKSRPDVRGANAPCKKPELRRSARKPGVRVAKPRRTDKKRPVRETAQTLRMREPARRAISRHKCRRYNVQTLAKQESAAAVFCVKSGVPDERCRCVRRCKPGACGGSNPSCNVPAGKPGRLLQPKRSSSVFLCAWNASANEPFRKTAVCQMQRQTLLHERNLPPACTPHSRRFVQAARNKPCS